MEFRLIDNRALLCRGPGIGSLCMWPVLVSWITAMSAQDFRWIHTLIVTALGEGKETQLPQLILSEICDV